VLAIAAMAVQTEAVFDAIELIDGKLCRDGTMLVNLPAACLTN
jgi:hypothetical protein